MVKTPLDFLEEMREKPESVRKLAGGVLVVLIMAAVLGIWATTLDLSTPLSGRSAVEASAGFSSPLATLWNFIKDSVKSFF